MKTERVEPFQLYGYADRHHDVFAVMFGRTSTAIQLKKLVCQHLSC